jgi:phosphomannomutase / phosphoglucomutase
LCYSFDTYVSNNESPFTMMTMTRSAACFCPMDVRAPIVEGIFDAQSYIYLARAVSKLYTETLGKLPTLAIGYDARSHSVELFTSLKNTLLSEGVSVVDCGMQASPMMYAMEWLDLPSNLPALDGVLIVTASHNPAPDNGLKWTLNRTALTKEEVATVKQYFLDVQADDYAAQASTRGTCDTYDPTSLYIEWSKNAFPRFNTPMKIVADAGNGTGGLMAPQLFAALGIEVISLHCEPDGRFPNHHPDPSKEKNMADLKRAVVEHGADFGVAFDGDSDRLGVVDNQGRWLTNDFLLLFFAESLMRHFHADPNAFNGITPKVVSEVKCSQLLFEGLEKLGAIPIMAPTGHAYIKQVMKKEGSVLGGELSGHFFFKDEHWGFDDAFYAALRVCQWLDEARAAAENPTLAMSDLVDKLPKTVLSEELRYKVDIAIRPQIMQELEALVNAQETLGNQAVQTISKLDGVRVALEGGFALVRTSNTEPVLTMRWESDSLENLETLETQLLHLVNKAIETATQKAVSSV